MKLPSRKRVRVLIATIGSTNSLELLRETIVTYGSKYKSDIVRVTEKKNEREKYKSKKKRKAKLVQDIYRNMKWTAKT